MEKRATRIRENVLAPHFRSLLGERGPMQRIKPLSSLQRVFGSLSPLKEKNPLMDEEERKKKDVNPDDFRQKEPSDADPKDEMEENIA